MMNKTFNLISLVSFVVVAAYGSIGLSEINHVSLSEISRLQKEFELAEPVSAEKLDSSAWSCSMIGVRSALQKLERIQLYNFKDSHNESIQNGGSHTINTYHFHKGELRGENSQRALTEQLRMSENRELIGKLSKTDSSGTSLEVAYSKCKQL